MKKTILSLITAALTMPTFAQYNGEGFYRIKNKGAAYRYISIANNKVEKRFSNIDPQTGFSQALTVWSLRTVKDPITDPGSVIEISGTTNDLSLKAQGLSTKELMKNYKLQTNGSDLFSEYKGTTVQLIDEYDPYIKDKDAQLSVATPKFIRDEKVGSYAAWEIIKIDNQNEYFGVAPEIKVGDKYYTTLYTFFAYELPAGMKAYYVDQHLDKSFNKYVNEPVAELIEITGQVPAGTPVILECSSQKSADNILKPLTSSSTKIDNSKNELSGNRFCFYSLFAGKEKTQTEYWNELRNVVEYESSMRVLGVDKNGKLALVPAAKDQLEWTDRTTKGYLPANTAYFTKTTGLDATASLQLVDQEEFKAAKEAAEGLSKQETMFNEQKDAKKKECEDMAMEGDDEYCSELINKAKKEIDDLQFSKDKSLDENLAAIDAIIKQLANDLSTYRASGIESIRQSETANNVWYDLQGRRLQGAPKQKGIYIKHSRKVIIK